MSDENYLNFDDSDVFLANDPMLSSTGQAIEPLTPLPPEYLTELPDNTSSDILDISHVISYSTTHPVFGTPSTSNNNNISSLYCLKSPEVGSPYFSPSPAPSPAMCESFQINPRIVNVTSINQYSDGDTNYLINYGDGEGFAPAPEMDTDNIPGKHSFIYTGLAGARVNLSHWNFLVICFLITIQG